MKKMLMILAAAMVLPCAAQTVLLDNPKEMNRTIKGNPESSRVVWRSKVVPAKPNTWYRATVEIKTAFRPGPGYLRFRVRQVAENDKSLVYANIAVLKPSLLNYSPYSDVFLTRPGTKGLQVYYHLSNLNGTASFRNLKLEEVSAEEAEKIRAAYKVPPAYFSPPAYAYEGEQVLPWGYRVSAELISSKDQIPAKIAIRLPELNAEDSTPAKANVHAKMDLRLNSPLKQGKYKVVMTALDASGKELAQEEKILRVIARPGKTARLPVKTVEIDPDGNTLINGKAVLIRGLYHVYNEAEVRDVADAGFNTVIAWERTPQKYQRMLGWMNKHDLYADCVIKRLEPGPLTELLEAIGGNASIISFDPEDEPDIKDIGPDRILPRVSRIREMCPGKPIRISCSNPEAVDKYAACADILCAHHYVIPFGGLPLQAQSTAIVAGAFPLPRKHSPHMTLQSWIHWHDLTRKPQTPEQTRSLAYIALINGAKGLWWYSFRDGTHWDVRKVPSIWTVFKGLNSELEQLSEIILTGKRLAVKTVTLTPDGKKIARGKKIVEKNAGAKGNGEEIGAICAVWQLPERTVMVAVNTMKAPVRARISGLPDGKITELFADGETVRIQAGTAEFPIMPETARVFEWAK